MVRKPQTPSGKLTTRWLEYPPFSIGNTHLRMAMFVYRSVICLKRNRSGLTGLTPLAHDTMSIFSWGSKRNHTPTFGPLLGC